MVTAGSGATVAQSQWIVCSMPSSRPTVGFQPSSISALLASNAMDASHRYAAATWRRRPTNDRRDQTWHSPPEYCCPVPMLYVRSFGGSETRLHKSLDNVVDVDIVVGGGAVPDQGDGPAGDHGAAENGDEPASPCGL